MDSNGGRGGGGRAAPKRAAERGSPQGGPRLARPLVPGIPSRVVDASGVVKRHERGPGQRRDEAQAAGDNQGRLVVGRGIHLKGEIESCRALVVHGVVEASLPGRVLEIAAGGRFAGAAEVEQATVAGRFEGELTVRGRLSVAAGGEVAGTVRYGELAVEPGGRLAGDVDALAAEPPAETAAEGEGEEAPVPAAAKEPADSPA